jgi:hypothetical protein
METVIIQMLKDLPVAGALIAVMWMFLRHMKNREVDWTETVKEISKRQEDAAKGCADATQKNTEVLSKLNTLIEVRIKPDG